VVISLITLVATLAIAENRPGVIGTGIFVLVMFVYYWGFSRHRLVAQSPEEEHALVREAEGELR
jgi:ethanolamine permease